MRGKPIRSTSMVLAGMLLTGSAFAQPVNDTCGGATPITSLPFSQSPAIGNTATDAGDDDSGACFGFATKGIWYKYTPSQNQLVTVKFFLTADPSVDMSFVFDFVQVSRSNSGGTCGSLGAITDCMFSFGSTAEIPSTATFAAQAGQTYYITVGPALADDTFPASAVYNISVEAATLPSAPANDAICGAVNLAAAPSSWTIDASGATDDTSNSTCIGAHRHGVWYKYTSTITGRATFSFDSIGALDAEIPKNVSVYTATGTCPGSLALTPVANANFVIENGLPLGSTPTCQSTTGVNTPARLTFNVSNGVTYYILAGIGTSVNGGPYPASVEYDLRFAAASVPSNDNCSSPITISSLPYSQTVSVGGATESTLGIVSFSNITPIQDVWYVYTPSVDQMVKVNWTGPYQAINSNRLLDFYLGGGTAIYSGTCGNLKPVGQLPGTPEEQIVTLRAGTTYHFMMGRRDGRFTSYPQWEIYADDTYTFQITTVAGTPPAAAPNDRCENAISLSPSSLPLTQTVRVIGNSDDVVGPVCFPYTGENNGPEIWTSGVWYTYTPPVNQFVSGGPLGTENCDAIFYTGTCGSLTPVGCDGRFIGRTLTAGTTYYFYAAAFPANQISTPRAFNDEYTFSIEASTTPTNDLCANAETVPSLPYVDTLNIGAATADSAGASCAGTTTMNRGVWYRYTAPASPEFPLMAVWNSHTAWIRGAISLFDGGCGGSLITCGDSRGAAFFEVEPGHTYTALVGDPNNTPTDTGPYNRTIQFHPAILPTNITCSTAYEITSFPFHAAADSTGGTVVALPSGCNRTANDTSYQSIFFTFTPAASGTVNIDISRTYGGDITVLYSGECNNLTRIACFSNNGTTLGQGISYRGVTTPTVTAEVEAGVRYTLLLGEYYDFPTNDSYFNLVDIELVTCRADFNGDTVRDVADLFAYINAWLAKTPSADFNNDSTVDVADLFAYINAWLAGC